MERNFPAALAHVLKHEGGFVNHADDPGGATNRGITIGTYRRYINRNGTVADLKRITDEQVARVYRRQYWDRVKGDELPGGVDYAVFDFGVNSGPSRAVKYLQGVVGVAQDGIIGPVTLASVKGLPSQTIIRMLCDKRMVFLKRLKHWPTFGRGWTRRVDSVRATALQMAAVSPTQPSKPSPRPEVPGTDEPASGKRAAGLAAVLAGAVAIVFAILTAMGVL